MIGRVLFLTLSASVLLAACQERQTSGATAPDDAAKINAECKSGQRSGPECNSAGAAITKQRASEGESEFRAMGNK